MSGSEQVAGAGGDGRRPSEGPSPVAAAWGRVPEMRGSRLATFLERACLVMAIAALAVVTSLSWIDTAIPAWNGEQFVLASEGSPLFGLTKAGLSVAMVAVAVIASRFVGRVRPRVVVPVVACVMTVASLAFVASHPTASNGFGDANFLISAANEAVSGGTELSGKLLDYLSRCPYQSGMYCYYVLMFKVFGENSIMSLQVMGVLANLVAFLSICSVARHFLRGDAEMSMLAFAIALLLPFWLLAGFPYGNATGFGLVMAFAALQVEAMRSDRVGQVALLCVASVPLAVAGLAIKATFILVVIAVAAVWLVRSLRHPRPAVVGLALALSVVLASSAFSSVCEGYAGRRLGAEVGDGIPTESRVLIGLTESDYFSERGIDAPGWWDTEAYDIYRSVDGDVQEQREIARQRLAESLRRMTGDPVYAIRFFYRKLASEWVDPTFNSVAYVAYNSDADGHNPFCNDESALPSWERVYKGFVLFEGSLQCAIATLALVGLVAFARRVWRDGGGDGVPGRYPMLAICATFCVGFCVYVLWEAKGVYCLPFFMMVVPVGAYGLGVAAGMLPPARHDDADGISVTDGTEG